MTTTLEQKEKIAAALGVVAKQAMRDGIRPEDLGVGFFAYAVLLWKSAGLSGAEIDDYVAKSIPEAFRSSEST
jgi:hypothetical protein